MTDPGIAPVQFPSGHRPESEFDGPADHTASDRLRALYAIDPTDPEAEVDTDLAASSREDF